MIKKEIKYTDFEGEPITKTFHFHLSKAELITLNHRASNKTLLEDLASVESTPEGAREVLLIFEEILEASVGRASDDGKSFIRGELFHSELFDTDALSELLVELVNDQHEARVFVEGVLPHT